MKSSNPIFSRDLSNSSGFALSERAMSISGTMSKLMLLALIMLIAASAVVYQFSLGRIDFVNIMLWIGVIAGFIISLIISFVPKTAPYLSPLYAFAEGAALSAISCFFEASFPGIVIQAVSITFLTVFSMAFLFFSGIIKATEKFKAVVATATLAICIFYFISLILMLFHVQVPYFSSNSPIAIGINVVFALVAALFLIIDFDNIKSGSERNYPALFEWYFAFGLLVTIVWLYLEILRLLSRLQRK